MTARAGLLALAAATLAPSPLGAADFTPSQIARLPEWAQAAAREALATTAPEEADAWVLKQRTELSYLGDGKVRASQLRLVAVLGERGLVESSLLVSGLAGKGSKLKRLKGWNVRPDGDVEQLERSDSVALDTGLTRLHTVQFQRAMKGSLLAFESVLETEHPMGPAEVLEVMEDNPVRSFSVEARSERTGAEVRMVLRHLDPWTRVAAETPHRSILIQDVPARPKDEEARPHPRNALPWLQVTFHDSETTKDTPSSANWNALAAWTAAKYAALATDPGTPPPSGADAAARLRTLFARFSREMTYKQLYLSPERGFIPLAAPEVARRKYGDCKDLSTLLIAQARAAGFAAHPVLARIVEGEIEEDEPPSVFAFNHVIVAIALPSTFGLGAEVETSGGRFLIVDPTARFVPLGRLSAGHAGRRVLICTDRGGLWVGIPDAAVLGERVKFDLAGALADDGAFSGTLTIREQDDGSSLRGTDVEGGAEELRRYCLRLGLPPGARCEVKSRSDPFDLERPYEVVFDLAYAGAMRSLGQGEWVVEPPGWRGEGQAIQKAGRARRYPVWLDRRYTLEYDLALRLPRALSPVLKEDKGETPLRTYAWSADVHPGSPPELRARFSENRRATRFDFGHREEGLLAWKKDRAVVRRLREDGLALKSQP